MTPSVALLARSDAAQAAAGFPPSLVSPPAATRVARLCALWPEGAACHVLELRLDGRGEPVDASQSYLAGALPDLAARARGQPMLAEVLAFLDWAAAARPRAISLEWDLDEAEPHRPRCPGAFFSLPDPPPADLTAHVSGGLAALNRAEAVQPVLAALAACAPDARLRQVGVLVSRPDAGVRLVLDCGSADAARAAMGRLDPAALSTLESLLVLPGFEAASRLDLDILPGEKGDDAIPDARPRVGPRIAPRIGVESGDARTTLEEVRACTDGLVRLGVINADAARALQERAAWASLDHRLMSGLSHLKASASGSDPPQVKAYQALLMRPDAMTD